MRAADLEIRPATLDSTNAPILHLNETMGYRRRPDMIQLLKAL